MRSNNDRPLAVDVPRAADDRPQWIKVGVIAAVGFAIGVVWPRLAGVRLGPSAPGDAPATAASGSPVAPPAPPPPSTAPSARAAEQAGAPAVLASAPASASAAPAAAPIGPPKVTVPRGVVLACKTDEGESLKGQKDCGALTGFDALAQPRIRRVKDCSAAEGASGKLSVVLGVDFTGNNVNVQIGKSSNVPNVESIGACVKQQFSGISLGALEHQHPRYTISYGATLTQVDAAAGGAPGSTPAAAGNPASSAPVAIDAPTASVVWEVAIVRDAPRTGQVVGRLQRGTKIRVGQGQENWYRVRYGAGFASEGWVYRGAIGK